MSRNIPAVRQWRVRYHLSNGRHYDFVTMAPNKLFARWNVSDHVIASFPGTPWSELWGTTNKVTISLITQRKAVS